VIEMGKKIKVQRRGRGTSQFRASKTNKISPSKYPIIKEKAMHGNIIDLVHESGRGSPLAIIKLADDQEFYIPAIEGIAINDEVSIGMGAEINLGNTLAVGEIPEGTMVCNVELRPGDGGKIARSSGAFATVISHTRSGTTLRLPSRKDMIIPNQSRATIGIVSGGGRKEKPRIKAGEAHHAARAKGHIYPIAHGVKMTAASHPHGGGRHRRPGKSTTVSRNAPPGAKVGLIAARQSGKKQRRRIKN
jgi:large subunit ribosomal protein L2